jgi:glucose/arabinose dehydrogenase
MKTTQTIIAVASLKKLRWAKANALLMLVLSLLLLPACKHEYNPPPGGSYDLKLVAGGFVSPLTVVAAPDGSDRLFVVDQPGQVWIVERDGSRMPEPFIDLSLKIVQLSPGYDERGLLGLAFHPGFRSNGKFYLFYTAPPREGGPEPGMPWNNLTTISEFRVSASNPNRADLSTEKFILRSDHPQGNHNGGTIAFGPDGYLYISIGDGGNKNDIGPGHVEDWYPVNEGGNGQDNKANLLGNILRIDVDHGDGKNNYRLPADNPFVGTDGRGEIYAFGFRNPYRFSFDPGGAHWLIAGDAGQNLYEEIDLVKKGGNYGWNVKEGRHCFNAENELQERTSCPSMDPAGNPLIDPVIEVRNIENPQGGETNAIVGGNIYRGRSIPYLFGKYIFGYLATDETGPSGKLLSSSTSLSNSWDHSELPLKSFPGNLGQYVKGFGQDSQGEVYTTTSMELGPQGNTGKVYKLIFVK